MKTKLYKFLRTGFRSENGQEKWQIGKWKKFDGEIKMCEAGFHCSLQPYDAFTYIQGEILAEVEVRGKHLKEKAIELWRELDYGNYANEKIGLIKDLENIRDNFMFMVAMFDFYNQMALSSKLSEGTRKAIRDRMKAGGATSGYIVF